MFFALNIIFLVFIRFEMYQCVIVDPGPAVVPTKGAVWPEPQFEYQTDQYFEILLKDFTFNTENTSCASILYPAFDRYNRYLDRKYVPADSIKNYNLKNNIPNTISKFVNVLNVNINNTCLDEPLPCLHADEKYTLSISEGSTSFLNAETVWGALRGLETFSQLVHMHNNQLVVRKTVILDFPRYPHRGLLVDTSRHYIPIEILLNILDAMSFNKLNVFHWHITDDQSFPYVSKKFPMLSEKGAYHPSLVYSPKNITKIIKYAQERGIRIVPEFDTPGHTRSWGEGQKDLLTKCYLQNGTKLRTFGPIDPTKNSTYTFLKTFFKEVRKTFPDPFLHLGGDEIQFDCWKNNNKIAKFMNQTGIGNFSQLQNFYMYKLFGILGKYSGNLIVWEEVFSNWVQMPNNTVVQLWKGQNAFTVLNKVLEAGYKVLFSSCWYLDHIQDSWKTYYNCVPSDFVEENNREREFLVLGGEACMWGEMVNANNIVSRIWPRASAVAERLWSSANVNNTEMAAHRLEEHTCRMIKRHVNAEPPNGPGFCI